VLVREELDRLLRQGAGAGENIISELVSTVTRLVVQELLEAEQTDFLGGRGRYEPRGETTAGGMRNGYEPGRICTAEGVLDVRVPQVRETQGEPFRSTLMGFLDGNSDVLENLVAEMYARGLSTRDVEDAFRDATGQLLISRSAVTGITDRLWEQFQAFAARDLSAVDLEYVDADAIFECRQLQLLRVELGIDPPPQQHTKSTKKKTAA
jgi:transposase-like protein